MSRDRTARSSHPVASAGHSSRKSRPDQDEDHRTASTTPAERRHDAPPARRPVGRYGPGGVAPDGRRAGARPAGAVRPRQRLPRAGGPQDWPGRAWSPLTAAIVGELVDALAVALMVRVAGGVGAGAEWGGGLLASTRREPLAWPLCAHRARFRRQAEDLEHDLSPDQGGHPRRVEWG